jgi:hypothetical protein
MFSLHQTLNQTLYTCRSCHTQFPSQQLRTSPIDNEQWFLEKEKKQSKSRSRKNKGD